ncbi:MAG: DUF2586 family protein [Bacteroidetes bacterium]|nr:DUF2586 family protein [Bacteroidota bacterium]
MFTGPTIIKGDGALGAKGASDDNIHGLVMGGVVTGTYATLGVSKQLIQASDADDYGFNAAYDATNKVLVRYHIDEYFRINPNGVLWVMVVAQTVTLAQMCDKTLTHVYKLISDSLKKVKSYGVVRNPAAGYTPTITDGIDADVTAAVLKAQELAVDYAAKNVFIDMAVIEGRELGATAGLWKDLRTLASPNVHVCVLQDKDIADLDALYAKTAAVGTCLGGIGIRRVEEDLAQVPVENDPKRGESYPINDAALGLWLRPAISSGVLTADLTAPEVVALKAKGFIFADSYPEYAGVYFSGSSACTDLSSDFAYGVNTRVWNKAARKAVSKLTPKLAGKVELVAGKIKATKIFSWESDVNNSDNGLGSLVSAGHCTEAKTSIDPNQDVFGTSKVVVKMKITPYGYAREIEGQLSFGV